MTKPMWIAYTPAGAEFNAQEEAEALGLWCEVPRRVDMLRRGTQRRPDPIVSAYLPNYIFVRMDGDEWHWLKASKLVRTIMSVQSKDEKNLLKFINKVEADCAERMAQIEAGQRVDEYSPGDLLTIITGPFAGTLASFKRVAEGASMFPDLVVETQMFGQAVTVKVDPIAARRAS